MRKNKKQHSSFKKKNLNDFLQMNLFILDVILRKKNVKNYLLNVVVEINFHQKKIEINGFDLNLNH
jgi:hypothetical protein